MLLREENMVGTSKIGNYMVYNFRMLQNCPTEMQGNVIQEDSNDFRVVIGVERRRVARS